MENTDGQFRRGNVLLLLFGGFAVTVIGPTPARAQTYYYYPTSVTAAPSGSNWTDAPGYYRRWGRYRMVWTGPAVTFSQTTVPAQNSQNTNPSAATPPNNAMQTTQASAPEATSATDTSKSDSKDAKESGDPYGFTAWLNATRAAYGLALVGHDPNLSNWAALNNNEQNARGMGHFVMGPARRQNAAVGAFPGVEAMWMASPAHRAALLDPTIRWIGIAGLGAYWTFNAN